MYNRRRFISGIGSLSLAAACAGTSHVSKAPAFQKDPFALGIASGSPTRDSVVLWTRIVEDPFAPLGGLGEISFPVRWAISERPDMSLITFGGTAIASPANAHSIHIDVQRLKPATRYWYRFFTGAAASQIGSTRTLPKCGENDWSCRFVTASCQNFAQGFFNAYEGIADDEPDFVIHLGDYIYEVGFGGTVREHYPASAPKNLDEFRSRHAQYKMDSSLQRAHATTAFFVVPDNHDAVTDGTQISSALSKAAYKAWYEHMPVRNIWTAGAAGLNLSQTVSVGGLVQVELLDTRQFRDPEDICRVTQSPGDGFGNFRPQCAEMLMPQRSMIGPSQIGSLSGRLRHSRSAWTVLASTVPFARFTLNGPDAPRAYIGSWNGYPKERDRIASLIQEAGIENFVVLSGDVHSTWIMDLRQDDTDRDTTYGTEITGTSISSDWPDQLAQPMLDSIPLNPHVQFSDVRNRGYVLHEVTSEYWDAHVRVVSSVKNNEAGVRTLRSARIKQGVRGLHDLL